ncbi:MAG: class I SAM-dependent methyltransferase [Candidatus Diapherotrites archaeon]
MNSKNLQDLKKTGERMIPKNFESEAEYLIFLQHLFAYEFVEGKISENSFVLEVGCGEGYGTSLLSKKAKRIIGLDVDKDTIGHASRKYGSEKCIFKAYAGKRLPFDNNTFDFVISFQAIEHVQDDLNFVSEIHRVLNKKGIFFVTTPNSVHRLKPGQKPWNRFHVREYSPSEFENLLKNRFSNVDLRGIRGKGQVQKISLERVKQNQKIVSLDPLNLRQLIPESIKPAIIKLLRKITNKKSKKQSKMEFIGKYSTDDYYIIEIDIDNSLDLLGSCKK